MIEQAASLVPATAAPVLDHGYLLFVEHWGSDERIIESARMSTDKGFLGWGDAHPCPRCKGSERMWGNGDTDECNFEGCNKGTVGTWGDEKLLAYLYNNKHSTPFEFAGLTIEIQAPVMVFREWHRHRTQSYSELSARYTPMPNWNYTPTVDRLMMVNTANKQANTVKGSDTLTLDAALKWLTELQDCYDHCERVYQKGLAAGVSKELARLPVPVARYSRMRATANLRNWIGFLTLRDAPNAQWEIREYAKRVGDLIKVMYPRTWDLFRLEREARAA